MRQDDLNPGRRGVASAVARAAAGCATMCSDVHERAAQTHDGKSNPPPSPLTHRQIAAARLLALGRTGRDAAREIGVNEHTVMRWRRLATFADEVRRQHGLVLAEQVRLGRSESVDAYAAVAEKIARKYGLA